MTALEREGVKQIRYGVNDIRYQVSLDHAQLLVENEKFRTLGLEPITVNGLPYKSWKIRRIDTIEGGQTYVQFLWYAPQLCTLSAFKFGLASTLTPLSELYMV